MATIIAKLDDPVEGGPHPGRVILTGNGIHLYVTYYVYIPQADSALKVQYLLDEKNKYRPDGPTDAELQEIFYTTKHQWFPQ